jgi:adenylylsulfate kinase
MYSQNIIPHNSAITKEDRNRQNSHNSLIVWFTGLSGSGKSTISYAIEEYLYNNNYRVFALDGDNIRCGLSSDLGFSRNDRNENIRRIGEVSKLMLDAGVIVLASFISPYKDGRENIRKLVSSDNFLEVYCNAPLETCELRDVKGFYKKAKKGMIKNYTGIDSQYEAPDRPELILDTENETLQESVENVLRLILPKIKLDKY